MSITAFVLVTALLLPWPAICGPIAVTSITPNFTASYLGLVDNSAPGAFLTSRNNSFQARLTNPKPESASYYFSVVQVISNIIVWSANRNAPISQSGELRLSSRGLTIYNDTGQIVWSTPRNLSSVSSLQLLESGNLVLLDFANNTVWQSFDFPTDVIVEGQRFTIGKSLVSSLSDEDLSEGSYRLVLADSDAMLQWNGFSYWKLSMETKASMDTNSAVTYMVLNSTGAYLIGDGGVVVFQIILSDALEGSSSFRMVKLDSYGVLGILKVDTRDGSTKQDLVAPTDNCQIPFVCRSLGLCTNRGSCQCAPGFHSDPRSNNGDCVPTNQSLALPASPCSISSSNDSKGIKYLNLRNDVDYFSNYFMDPMMKNMNLSACEDSCSRNCSCMGFFYSGNTRFCYVIMDYVGSFLIKSSSSRDAERLGFIKTLEDRNPGGDSFGKKSDFPIMVVVLFPLSGVMLIVLVGIIIWLRWRRRRMNMRAKTPNSISGRAYSLSSADGDDINLVSIPGLPVHFDYKELAVATEGFKTQIGSGGFGIVYMGTLGDGTHVAVKKITCLGSRGNKEFLSEIAVIGKIHHINLVRLKGFCAFRGERFLVYEFMNRGSLDRTLFGGENECILEWTERYQIALGTARGLAYLHSGCDHKIIHCDVKPENILLHNDSQVKISDFGLSKLLSPEQSGLFTTMRGTRGYLAPEWLTNSTISEKTDVYSYGMVLLEILRGRKNSSVQYTASNNNLIYFPLFALEMYEEGRYLELVDPRLAGKVRVEEVERVVRVALCCVHEEPNLRPSMSNVVGMLEGGMPSGEPMVESLNFLRFYGRRFTEASEGNIEFVVPISGGSTSSYNSFSYISSQQVSGPR